MNKTDLVAAVQKALGKSVTKADATRAVEAVLGSIKTGVIKGKTVQIIGFGSFKISQRKARAGVNPKTGERITIRASKGVKFRSYFVPGKVSGPGKGLTGGGGGEVAPDPGGGR